jgi:hypothetical protein
MQYLVAWAVVARPPGVRVNLRLDDMDSVKFCPGVDRVEYQFPSFQVAMKFVRCIIQQYPAYIRLKTCVVARPLDL